MHTADVVAAATLAYAPAVHTAQAATPVAAELKEPTAHGAHVVAAGPAAKYPATHTVHADEPVVRLLYEPTEQAVQEDAPAAA